jgi:antimicrobial peptide system SdpB family protein
MTDRLIKYLKNRHVHTPAIALARFLLAFGMLLTLLFNDMSLVADHSYAHLPQYVARHSVHTSIPLKQLDIFMQFSPAVAKGIAIAVLLLVITGLVPQVSAVLHFIVCFSFRNYFVITNGGDEVTYIMSLLLLPLCLSDPRLNQWKEIRPSARSSNITGAIALFGIQLQAAYIYFSAGFGKLFTDVWRQGTAVYYYTSHYRLGARGILHTINEWFTTTPLVYVLTWGILLFEICLPLALLMAPRYRTRMFIAALFFHLLIVINFGLITFFFAMAGMLVLFLQPGTKKVQDLP